MKRLLGFVCVAVVGGAVWCGGALAVEVHPSSRAKSFGEPGSAPGQFNEPLGVAVDDQSHDVYVVDRGNKRVEKFNSDGSAVLCENVLPTGGYDDPREVAVDDSEDPADPSRGDVYVVDIGKGVVDKFNASCGDEHFTISGGGPVTFEAGEGNSRSVEGVAIGTDGQLWIAVKSGPLLEFSNAAHNAFVRAVPTAFGGSAGGLGVDAEENIYINTGGGEIAKVSPSGETLENPFCKDTKAYGLAVDAVGGEVYLNGSEAIVGCRIDGSAIEGTGLEGAIAPSFGSGMLTLSSGLGVDVTNGTVYASDRVADRVFVFEAVLLPTVVLTGLSKQQPRSVTLNGTVNPEGREVTSCVFEYATASVYRGSGGYDHKTSCVPAAVGSGDAPVAVSANLAGLLPGEEYCYRLVAENSVGAPSATPSSCFVTGPLVTGEFAAEVGSESVALYATIDPNGADTSYYVEYGTSAAYGSWAPVSPPGSDIGAQSGVQAIVVHLQGLEQGTTYHYRFVAVQAGETFEGSPVIDRTFTTQVPGVAGTADGRVWELVSPVDKKGGLIELFQAGGQVQAADDGGGVAYVTQGTTVGEDPSGKPTYSQVISRRTATGWHSADVSLPGRLPEDEEAAVEISGYLFEYRLFSPDLSRALVEPQAAGTPPLAEGVSERTLYLRDDENGSFTPLVWPGDVPPGTKIEERNFNSGAGEWEMMVLASTPDLSHVLFKTPMALTSEAPDEEHVGKSHPDHVQWNLYVWADGELKLVNILPNKGGVAHGEYPLVPTVKPAGTGVAGGRARGSAQRVMSDDGRMVAWTWGEPYSPETLKSYRGLFLRDMVEGRTVKVGGPQAVYQTMNSDGSKVFYLEEGKLFVYEYASKKTTDLTPSAGAGVLEYVGDVSSDGSHVYFVSTGALATGASEGEDNLYLAENGEAGWSIRLVATLARTDKPSWYAEAFGGAPQLSRIASRVSSDGRYLVFMSSRSLTGYDNLDAVSGVPDEEVFEYDSQTDRLACVSCDPTGARPTGVFDTNQAELLVDRSSIWTETGSTPGDPHSDHWLAGNVPGWNALGGDTGMYQPRYSGQDGRVFFDSPIGLVAGDTNGLEDVYEWEPLGVGGCGPTGGAGLIRSGEGCVGLISSGTSNRESAFYDASESGEDVFFATAGKLAGEDVDAGYDLYDAHLCSATVPCPISVTPSPPCVDSYSCKGGVTASQPEIFGPPPTATFSGQGNQPPDEHKQTAKKTVKRKRARRACPSKHKRPHRRQSCARHRVAKRAKPSAPGGRGKGAGR